MKDSIALVGPNLVDRRDIVIKTRRGHPALALLALLPYVLGVALL